MGGDRVGGFPAVVGLLGDPPGYLSIGQGGICRKWQAKTVSKIVSKRRTLCSNKNYSSVEVLSS